MPNISPYDMLESLSGRVFVEVGGVPKELEGCLISYNLQIACVRKLEVF